MTARIGVAVIAALLVACTPPDDQETGSISGDEVREARTNLPEAFVEVLDSGNAAYRRGDYQDALAYYEEAVDMEADIPAGWFGIYMAQQALGNPEAADSALVHARDLAPGASLIHPDRDTTP